MRTCLDHAFPSSIGPAAVAVPPQEDEQRVYSWDIVCLLCGRRREARGTVDQARVTMRRLAPCKQCGGVLLIEHGEVGAISSPSAVHSAIYRPGYGISTRPEAAA